MSEGGGTRTLRLACLQSNLGARGVTGGVSDLHSNCNARPNRHQKAQAHKALSRRAELSAL